MNERESMWRLGLAAWRLGLALAAGALALTLMAVDAFAGQITLYERPYLRGQNMTTTMAIPNLQRSEFNDFAASVVVGDGTWEACTEPNYRGRCAQLAPGTYSQLGGQLNGPVASVHQISIETESRRFVVSPDVPPNAVSTVVPANAVSTVVSAAAAPPVVINPGAAPVIINPAPAAVVVNPEARPVVVAPSVVSAMPVSSETYIVLYRHTGQVIRAVELTSSVDDLDTRQFHDGADAALVIGGTWRLCDGEHGRGQCSDFVPGQYVSLGALDGRVRSAYLIAGTPGYVARIAVPAGRAVLYELPNFGGAQAVVESGPAPDLAWAHFRKPASSVRVESGSWLVCTDLGYQGDCRVLQPGEYPVLAGSLGQGIASARQVWRPEYGSAGRVVVPEGQRPDLSRYVP